MIKRKRKLLVIFLISLTNTSCRIFSDSSSLDNSSSNLVSSSESTVIGSSGDDSTLSSSSTPISSLPSSTPSSMISSIPSSSILPSSNTSVHISSSNYSSNNSSASPSSSSSAQPLPPLTDYYEDLFSGDWNRPGLYEKNGTAHSLLTPNIVTGSTINVLNYGAIANDSNADNTAAFKSAINAATSGSEVYIPSGDYYFKTNNTANTSYISHILMKTGVNFRGENKSTTRLISNFAESINSGSSQSTVIAAINVQNVTISDLTISSVEEGLPDSNNSSDNSELYKAPKNGIAIDQNSSSQTKNIVVRNVKVERFRRMGIRVVRSRDVLIENNEIERAVDLGGGGAGYGIVFQGQNSSTTESVIGTNEDTLHNRAIGNKINGPYIRHGILLQYYAHNNLVKDNIISQTLLDAVDLHGENEFSNLIVDNQIINTRAGAGVGVGNTGSTHKSSGRLNMLLNNTISGGLRGIDVVLGSPKTIIINNLIENLQLSQSVGITISSSADSRVLGNSFNSINGPAIKLIAASNTYLIQNSLSYCKSTIIIDSESSETVQADNRIN